MTQKGYYRNEEIDQNVNTKDFLIGALIGGIVGAMTALLLAPKSGRELREDIHKQSHLLREKADYLKESAMDKGSELAALAKEKTGTITDLVSEQSQEWVAKMKSSPLEELEAEDGQADEDMEYTAEDIERKLADAKQSIEEAEARFRE